MNENYLQFIWKVKRIPFHLIKTTTNQSITIKNVGIHNTHESGPDFTNGRILLDGIEWAGNIEIHVKSSDWYKHNHQHDEAYNNVILHVVLEHDQDVYINETPIPTIELKDYIDDEHFEHWKYFADASSEVNCRKSLPDLETIYLESMMERAVWDRLNRKSFFLKQDTEISEPQEMLYFLFARAFGVKVNQFPFEEMSRRLPLSILKSVEKRKQKELILATSGIDSVIQNSKTPKTWIEMNRKFQIGTVTPQAWKRKGLRPHSYPEIRINQFAHFISNYDFDIALEVLNGEDLVSYTNSVFSLSFKEADKNLSMSTSFQNLLLINAIIPFLWWYAEMKQDDMIKSRVVSMLESFKPENNTIIDVWKKLGIRVKNAFESQALIELYNEHCMKNKCLSCAIGVQILK